MARGYAIELISARQVSLPDDTSYLLHGAFPQTIATDTEKEKTAARDDLIKIVDESSEDYLYHRSHFVIIDLPKALTRKLIAIEKAA